MYSCTSRRSERRPLVASPTDPHRRVSEQDREAVVRLLSEHTAAQRLTLHEFEERVGAVYTAERVGELEPLLAGLPESDLAFLRRGAVERPRDRAGDHAGMAAWGGFLMVAMVCLVIWALTSVSSARLLYFWPMWVIGPWGMSMLLHGAGRRSRPRRSNG